jgi:DNA-binding LacI/PurR family transcriptional regulator
MNSKNPPTAITAFNDLLAIGAQGATNGEVAVTGYDNTFLADLRQISLTSVDPGNTEIANKAAQLLLMNDKTESAKTYLMEPKLVVRNSSKSLVRNN